jgi:hypothetical protein
MMAVMAILKIPLDMTTIMIFSIALGIVVDDTLHFIHGYSRCCAEGQNTPDAIYNTLHTTGRAMVITTCLLVIAFGANVVSELSNVYRFGLLISMVAILALVSDFVVAPALLTLTRRAPKTAASRKDTGACQWRDNCMPQTALSATETETRALAAD